MRPTPVILPDLGAAPIQLSLWFADPGDRVREGERLVEVVVSGATSGDAPPAELTRVFFLQLSVIGSTMGTRDELERLIRFCLERGIEPPIHATLPLADAREGFQALLDGDVVGKIVFTP